MASAAAARIEITPGICGGRPRIAGHRIRVQDVAVWHELQGLSPDEIVSAHPTLSLADVHAALCYYHQHRDLIDSHIRAERQFIEATRARLTDQKRGAVARYGKAASLPPRRERGRGRRKRAAKTRR